MDSGAPERAIAGETASRRRDERGLLGFDEQD
jgi:hypothetical protein